jgi:hypothetical protein
MATIQIENKGIQFDSPYTDIQAAQTFRGMVEQGRVNSDFAMSLYHGAKKHGAYTARQIPWVHVIVAQAEGRLTRPTPPPTTTNYRKVVEHLAKCRQSRDEGGKGLLHPMVGVTVNGQRVVLKLAGKKSRHQGKVSVTDDHRYGHGQFYGYIDQDGSFASRNAPESVVQILDLLADDPAATIAAIGKESGHCCYCFAELSTVQSKIAGCGATCAQNYGTHYPSTTETRQYVGEHPEVLDGASDRDRWI